MNWLSDLFTNPFLMVSLGSWFIAQFLKVVIDFFIHKTWNWERLFGDGGMPSGHSATVTSLAVTAGLEYGLGSAVFASAATLAIIVMHDAMSVRLEAGKHAKALNDLLELLSSDLENEIKLKELLGHTPIQVVVGAMLGLCVALTLQ